MKVMKARHLLTISLCAALLLTAGAVLLRPHKAEALSGSEFQAGRIMDDNVLYDGNAMDIPSIQTFLNAKVPTCDTNGTQASGHGMSRAAWGTQNGNPPPFTCLRDYTTAVYGTAADQYCSAIPYGNYSAAGVIWAVGHACNVSQKVIIVLLQKEQSLITDDWPWTVQYNAATGYACPDSGGCDGAYSSFFMQVYYGARQYQIYAQKPDLFNFQRNITRNIGYNPNTGCGGSSVYIQNRATAGLYNYTPYQPNPAALANLYGTGDGCSAYGNRNFWRMYNDWFGNTYGIPYSASFRGVSPEASVTQYTNGTLWFDFQNTGAMFWKDDTSALPYYPRLRLAGSWPTNRVSPFADSSWPSGNRPVSVFTHVYESDGTTLASDQHTVWPGQVARFQFPVHYPGSNFNGPYRENFELVQDGAPNWWVPGGFAWQTVNVPAPYAAVFSSISGPAAVSPSHPSDTLWINFQNAGASFWKDDSSALPYYPRLRLAGSWPTNRISPFADTSWLSNSRPVSVFTHVYESNGTTLSSDQHTVWPGQIAKFQFTVKYPTGGMPPGVYRENYELVQDGAPNWWVISGFAWQNVTASGS